MEKKNLLSFVTAAILITPFTSSAKMLSVGDPKTGSFTIGGNAELNINFRDHDTPPPEINNAVEEENEIDQDGRLLIEFAGKRALDDGYYVNFVAEALFNTSGTASVDDAYLTFGKEKNWSIQTGRFEAFDMFPDPMDVFVEYSGDTSNSLYQDDASYSYQLAEARGRGSDGQILVNKHFRNLYLEANFLLGNRSGLFSDGKYHGLDVENQRDTIVARPVISYQLQDFNFAVAAETNLISDAVVGVVEKDANGKITKTIDVLERYGYSTKLTWDNGEFSVHGMFAYMDAPSEINKTIGITGEWKDKIALGLIHSFNKYDNEYFREGDVDVSTVYATYAFRNVLDVDNFSVLLGGYLSELNDDSTEANKDNDLISETGDAGGRIRLHYVF